MRVTLNQSGWEHAINGHPEVAPHAYAAKAAVESPSAIFQSATRKDSVLFFNHNVLAPNGDVLTVPVRVIGYDGIVTSIHFRPAAYPGDLLWKP